MQINWIRTFNRAIMTFDFTSFKLFCYHKLLENKFSDFYENWSAYPAKLTWFSRLKSEIQSCDYENVTFRKMKRRKFETLEMILGVHQIRNRKMENEWYDEGKWRGKFIDIIGIEERNKFLFETNSLQKSTVLHRK